MTSFHRTAFIVLFTFLLPSQLMAVDPLSAKKRYLSRDEVDSPATGFSFLLPRHFRGSYDPRTDRFFMKNRDGLLIGVLGFSAATRDEVSAAALAGAEKMGINTRESQENLDPKTILAHFTTQSAAGPGIMVHIAEAGKAGNALAMMAFGKPEHKERITKKVMRVMARVEWREPAAPEGSHALAGKMLINNSGQPQIAFFKNGRFRAHGGFFPLFSNNSASAQNHNDGTASGTWRQAANLAEKVVLLLQAADAQTFQAPFNTTETEATINGTTYALHPAKTCS